MTGRVTRREGLGLLVLGAVGLSGARAEAGHLGFGRLPSGREALTVPPGVELILIGSNAGDGSEAEDRLFVRDKSVDGAYALAHPASAFVDAAGSGFRQTFDATLLTAALQSGDAPQRIGTVSEKAAMPAYLPNLSSLMNGLGLHARFADLTAAETEAAAKVDQSAKLQAFLDVAAAYPGNPLFFDAGWYSVEAGLKCRGGMVLEGKGRQATFLRARYSTAYRLIGSDSAPGLAALLADDPEHPRGGIGIKGMSFVGWADDSGARKGGALLHLGINTGVSGEAAMPFNRAFFEDVGVRSAWSFGLACAAREVHARGLTARRTGRDAFHFAGVERAIIDGVDVDCCGDDALAVHLTAYGAYANTGRRRQIIVTNVNLSRSLGVKVLGLQTGIISNVNALLPTGYAVYLGYDGVSHEGSAEIDCTVTNIVARDIINPGILGSPSAAASAGVYVTGLAYEGGDAGGTSASGADLPLAMDPPGPASGTGAWIRPEVWLGKYGEHQPRGPHEGLTIRGVKVRQTLAGGSNFSDFGVPGMPFLWGPGARDLAGSGEQDPAIASTITLLHPDNYCAGVLFDGATVKSATLDDIQCVGGRNRIYFNNCDVVDFIQIRGGLGERLSQNDIAIGSADGAANIRINGGVANLDPYHEHPGRSGAAGGWKTPNAGGDAGQQALAAGFAAALYAAGIQGIAAEGYTIKNAYKPVHSSSGTNIQARFIVEMDAAGLKGCGVELDWGHHTLIYVDSDPTSATYGAYLGPRGSANGDTFIRAAVPSGATEYFGAGQFVRNSGSSRHTPDGNNKLLLGWAPRTSGAANAVTWNPHYMPATS